MSKRIFALAGLLGMAVTLVRAEPVGLAVAEDVAWYADSPHGYRHIYEPRLRALFVKDKSGWRLACKNPSGWRAECEALDFTPFQHLVDHVHGRRNDLRPSGFLGAICNGAESCSSPAWLNVDPGKIDIDIGDRTFHFSGIAFQPARKPRPISSMNAPILDPEGWQSSQPVALTPEESKWALASLAKLTVCYNGEAPPFKKVALRLGAGHLKVVLRFVSRSGASIQLVSLSDRLKKDCREAGGSIGRAFMHEPQFILTRSGRGESARHVLLGRISDSRDVSEYPAAFAIPDLIQFGDFDGDGKSEALFHLRSYQERGYLLLHEGMRKAVRFSYGGN